MKITIRTKNLRANQFIYLFLPRYIYSEYLRRLDKNRLLALSNYFEIDLYQLTLFALKHLLITKTEEDVYIIQLNRTLKYEGHPIDKYINAITYGNRQIKGYPIIKDLFSDIAQNINMIYER